MLIKDIMTKHIIVSNDEYTISSVSELMLKYNLGFIPIAKDNKIIGVITDRDIIIKALTNNESASKSIESYINRNIISIDENNTIDEALILMGKEKIKRLIVTDESKVTGIITIADILNHNLDNQLLLETLRTIYDIKKNDNEFIAKIDQFIL